MYNKGSSLPTLASILLAVLLFCAGALLGACSRDNGSEPYIKDDSGALSEFEGLDSSLSWSGGGMRISVNPAILKATTEDQAAVTVTLYDDNHNPIAGKTIRFGASHGLIDAEATTDTMGMATATFHSEAFEGDAFVGAAVQVSSDSVLRVARKVSISGLDLLVKPEATDVQTGTKVTVAVELLDAAGNALSNETVVLGGDVATNLTTDGAGKASFTLTRESQDTATITASVLGAITTTTIRFWTKVPEGTTTTTGPRDLRLYASRSQLRADNSDEAEIIAILVNEKNNPAQGDTVYFQSNYGVIGAYGIVDNTGRAKAVLRSAPISGTCVVKASAYGNTVSDSVALVLTGLSLALQSPSSGARVGEYVDVGAVLQDASNNPIGGDPIRFTVTGGKFKNGTTVFTTNLDGNGKATAQVTSASAGTVVVRAEALSTVGTASLTFSLNQLTLRAAKGWLRVGGNDSTTITAKYTDGSGEPMAGKTVLFYTTAGSIGASGVTNVLGEAVATIKSADFSGNATIQAIATNASAEMTLEMRASSAAAIKLSTTPDNIGINGGVTGLIAEVTDANGNTVSDEKVSFRILQGPGGGETISNAVVATIAGTAKSSLTAGSRPSAYQGVLVEASLSNGQADTIKLTISGLPYTITVSRPQDDTIVVQEAGQVDQSIFRYFVGAVVQDVNGNPVADGTPVHFSAVVSGMAVYTRYLVEWEGINGASDLKAKIGYRRLDIPFEDINNDYAMDASIDLTLDFNDLAARRGDDGNGDGIVTYSPATHDFWYDFDNDGGCDPDVGEPRYTGDTNVYADLDRNGYYTASELVIDHDNDGVCDLSSSGDFRYWLWEMMPMWKGVQFNFDQNDFAVVIAVSATTVGGVAQTTITYPRQLANRLFTTVNAEANGVKDTDGERFLLPVIIGQ